MFPDYLSITQVCIGKVSCHLYWVFSLTWPAFMQMYWNKKKRLHKKRVQLPQDWFGTPTWPPFHCFGTPRWPPWRHVKTLYTFTKHTKHSLSWPFTVYLHGSLSSPIFAPQMFLLTLHPRDLELLLRSKWFSPNFHDTITGIDGVGVMHLTVELFLSGHLCRDRQSVLLS